MRASTILVPALALISACGGRSSPLTDATSPLSDVEVNEDRAPNDSKITLPWVSTYAGTSCGAPVDGPRLSATLWVGSLALGSSGKLYNVGSYRISVVTETGVHTLAGAAGNGTTPVDGPASTAILGKAGYIAVGADDRIYFVSNTVTVRLLYKDQVSTIAGNSKDGQHHVDGPALSARFAEIRGLAVTPEGDLIIADAGYLRRLSGGQVTTIAGKGICSPTDGPALTSCLNFTWSPLVVGSKIYFADYHVIRVLENDMVTTISGSDLKTSALFADGSADDARFSQITWLSSYKSTIYIADPTPNNRIRKLEGGYVSSVTNGDVGLKDGPLAKAEFDGPGSVVVDSKGNLYIGDGNNCRIRHIQLH
jgi:hypothetical protein